MMVELGFFFLSHKNIEVCKSKTLATSKSPYCVLGQSDGFLTWAFLALFNVDLFTSLYLFPLPFLSVATSLTLKYD
jgi:hypothetical protein